MPIIFDAIRKERGELGLVQVSTFGTETSKSAVQTACRGYRAKDENGKELFPQGIDVDISQYLSMLIPVERGFVWPIKDVIYGNEEKERKPVTLFAQEVAKYPGLEDIMLNIEGIIKQRGIHASGVVLYTQDTFYDEMALMRAPNGNLVTQWDLHDAEWMG